MDIKVSDIKSNDKLSTNLSEKCLNENISKQAKNQLADIDDQDNKMFNLLLKNVNKFQKFKLTYFKLDEAGHSEETQKHLSLVEKTILINSTYRHNGLLNLNSYNLQLIFS